MVTRDHYRPSSELTEQLIVPHSKELDALEAAPADQQAEVNAKLGPLVSEWVDKYGYEGEPVGRSSSC